MPDASRKFIVGILLSLSAGAVVGWIYGYPVRGLLVAALLVLAFQVRQTLLFVKALRDNDFEAFRDGDGIWQQIYSRFSYEHERASRQKARYNQVLREIRRSTNAMPDGAVIINVDNEIVACNRAAKSLAGLKRKKDRGQRVDNILRDPKLMRLLQSNDYSRSIEIASPVRDDAWLNCRVVPYSIDQKLLFIRDVTERIRLSRTRRDFVANASHELRSPLTVISGYLETLAHDQDVPSDWTQPVAQMRSEADRMNRIVSELMELSRLESAGKAPADEIVDVAALLAGTRKAYHRPGSSAVIEVQSESAARIRGNIGEIESLISNLVSNAVRHTPPDGRITLTWRSGGEGAELEVRDTGEGIPEDHLPRLTERFYRVDQGRSREDGGVGLGLAIVKHVLGRYDATLAIASEPGDGSVFTCRFPTERIVVEPPIPLAG